MKFFSEPQAIKTSVPSTISQRDELLLPHIYGWSDTVCGRFTCWGLPDKVMYSTRNFSTGSSGAVQVARKERWVTSDVTRLVGGSGKAPIQIKGRKWRQVLTIDITHLHPKKPDFFLAFILKREHNNDKGFMAVWYKQLYMQLDVPNSSSSIKLRNKWLPVAK